MCLVLKKKKINLSVIFMCYLCFDFDVIIIYYRSIYMIVVIFYSIYSNCGLEDYDFLLVIKLNFI